ncbi:MAG: helix-turn-helix domain-containing protein [Anaerolineae bacterium]|nr:helix-turn-helix domain-containing protein [Anaerolineae bacterium]
MARKPSSRNSTITPAGPGHNVKDNNPCSISQVEHKCSCKLASSPLELPRDRLAITVRKVREASGKSIYRLAEDSGVEGSSIWRIESGERKDLTRETLLLLSLGVVLNSRQVDQVIEVANEILDAAGLKMLRAPWENESG